jgi:hypothetical protein
VIRPCTVVPMTGPGCVGLEEMPEGARTILSARVVCGAGAGLSVFLHLGPPSRSASCRLCFRSFLGDEVRPRLNRGGLSVPIPGLPPSVTIPIRNQRLGFDARSQRGCGMRRADFLRADAEHIAFVGKLN